MRRQLAALGVFLAACGSDEAAVGHDLAVVRDAGHQDAGHHDDDAGHQDAGQPDAAPPGCACDTATSYCFRSCGGATSCEAFQEGCQPATPACEGNVTCGCLQEAGVIRNTGEYPCWVADGGVVTVTLHE